MKPAPIIAVTLSTRVTHTADAAIVKRWGMQYRWRQVFEWERPLSAHRLRRVWVLWQDVA